MAWIRALAPIVFAAGTALAGFPALAQSTSPPEAKAKREKVDVRAMVPGPQASDAASDVRPAGGLTRDQRKEATLQARQEGALQPAGDAAEVREAKPLPLPPDGGIARTAAADAAPASPAQPTGHVEAGDPAAKVATASPSSPAKKSTRKKPRGAAPTTPA
jgi:hypothetical protein